MLTRCRKTEKSSSLKKLWLCPFNAKMSYRKPICSLGLKWPWPFSHLKEINCIKYINLAAFLTANKYILDFFFWIWLTYHNKSHTFLGQRCIFTAMAWISFWQCGSLEESSVIGIHGETLKRCPIIRNHAHDIIYMEIKRTFFVSCFAAWCYVVPEGWLYVNNLQCQQYESYKTYIDS